MPEALVGHGSTNSTAGSIATVKINEYICNLDVEKNEFGDTLPIIPTVSRTDRNKVLYQLKIRAKLTQNIGEKPVPNHRFAIRSNRTNDKLEIDGATNQEGETTFTLTTRDAGELELSAATDGITLVKFSIKLREAWYESPFLITGYNVCKEDDFSGELVDANGLEEKHIDSFLYSATGIPMQGTGIATDGKYIKIVNKPKWRNNSRGHPEWLENPNSAIFKYVTAYHGHFGDITENHSIAVDINVIPKHCRVEIDGVGVRIADDSGGGIKLYHIDNYLGAGAAVVKAWLKGGINGTKRRVKYLGVSQ